MIRTGNQTATATATATRNRPVHITSHHITFNTVNLSIYQLQITNEQSMTYIL